MRRDFILMEIISDRNYDYKVKATKKNVQDSSVGQNFTVRWHNKGGF